MHVASLPRRFGRYLLLEPLGSGGMGDVFLARPLSDREGLPAVLVLKRLHAELADEAAFVHRFSHEARIATRIESPHVVKVYDAGCVDDVLYIAMELIEGWSVAHIIDRMSKAKQQISLASIGDLVGGALQGLEALHTAADDDGTLLGIVHRDIAPKNIMVGKNGRTCLIDLGIGRSRLKEWKTRTGAVLGSPGYMSPEQVRAHEVDHRSDLFSMGVVLFELLTLERFIPQGSLATMLHASANPVFRPPSQIRSDARALDPIVERALAPEPADRFQSAHEFLTALRDVTPHRATSMDTLLGDMIERRWPRIQEAPAREGAGGPEPRMVVFAHRSEVSLGSSDLDPTYVPRRAPSARRSGSWGTVVFGTAMALLGAAVALALTRNPELAPAPKPSVTPLIRQPSVDQRPIPPALPPVSRIPKQTRTAAPPSAPPPSAPPPSEPPTTPEAPSITLDAEKSALVERVRLLRRKHEGRAGAWVLDDWLFELQSTDVSRARVQEISRRVVEVGAGGELEN